MILVTGSTGFVGLSLMRLLSDTGIEAKGLNGRIQNLSNLREQLADVHTVVHLAGGESRGRVRTIRAVDVQGTQTLVEACQQHSVQHIIYLSRLGADPAAWQPLLKAKGEAERIIQKSGIPYTILRSTSLYGWGDRYFEMIIGLAIWSWPLIWLPGNGRSPVQPLWVEDLVRCIRYSLVSAAKKNNVYNLAGGERMSYYVLTQRLLGMSGLRRLPFPLHLRLLKPFITIFFRWWYWPAINRFYADRFFVPEVADTDSVRRAFGFQPTRVSDSIAFVNRAGLRWRLFRK
jgi:NADH dehydrogenase